MSWILEFRVMPETVGSATDTKQTGANATGGKDRGRRRAKGHRTSNGAGMEIDVPSGGAGDGTEQGRGSKKEDRSRAR